ncbi:metalloregulator ArsR/SmtB family transcription factor [Pelagibius litoralis]|uniref:Metalloregulator ArsR/SmtB family transcription factor n=1 Tax=Pelagibius litoralis TaxID=374515 RepID=A0A967C3E0_9PROT|nr:metalloregulator ArsR/SmtB family transcription factor [Pelagibius litoralis]NIA67500.1 metalloregulator ArsR/SmtB family transcription factor [Pelagibius litoralis]
MDNLLAAMKAAAEPTRLRLLVLCAHGDLTVSDLVQILGQSQPRVSRHLRLLTEAGLLDRNREGSWVYYRLAQQGPTAGLAQTLVDSIPGEDPTVGRDLGRLESVMAERARRAEDYFHRMAARWDEVRALYVQDDEVESLLRQLISREKVSDLLDVGTGTGRILEILAGQVERAVGIDLSPDMLMIARSKLERARLRNCVVRKGDMYNLPAATGSFDAVTVHQVLHYAERPAQAIEEAARVLRPGGRLFIVDFQAHAQDVLRDEHEHRWLGFEENSIATWLKDAGLEPAESRHLAGNPLTISIWSARRQDAPVRSTAA